MPSKCAALVTVECHPHGAVGDNDRVRQIAFHALLKALDERKARHRPGHAAADGSSSEPGPRNCYVAICSCGKVASWLKLAYGNCVIT